MRRFVFVHFEHKESENCTREADTQFAKEQNNISYNIYPPYAEDVTDDKFCCNSRSPTEALSCYSNLKQAMQIVKINQSSIDWQINETGKALLPLYRHFG